MAGRCFEAACLLLAALPLISTAQTYADRGAVRFSAGFSKLYLDEPSQFVWAASVRFRIAGRFSVEPEFVNTRGRRFNEWAVVPNLVVDLAAPGKRVTPYVIGGIGYRRQVDKSIAGGYVSSGSTLNARFGVRVRIARGLFLSPELRVGKIGRVVAGLGATF
jgi:hypothetical protein